MNHPQGLRIRRADKPKRTRELKIALTDEEYEALFDAAGYTDQMTAAWARDVLVSRAASLFKQRMLS